MYVACDCAMSSEGVDEKRALINLSQFVFRKEAGKIREGLYDSLVELAVFLGGDKGVLASGVQSIIKDTYPITLHQGIVDSSLIRLWRSRAIVRRSDNRYYMEVKRKWSVSDQINDRKGQIERLSDAIFEEVKLNFRKDISEEVAESVKVKFFVLLSSFLTPRAKVSAAILTGKGIEIPEMEVKGMFKETLADITDPLLKGAVEKAFIDLFQKADKEMQKLLFDIAENIYLLEVLNLDPECQCLQRIEFSKIRLLLDTNVIISLLCPSDRRRHRMASNFVDICRSFGIQLYYTDLTVSEYERVLEVSNTILPKIETPLHLLGDHTEPFVSSYAEELKQNPDQTWEGYYLRMKRLGGDIENRYALKRFAGDWDEIFEKDFFEEVSTRVSGCWKIHVGTAKSKAVAQHDAFHLILVRELRKEEQKTVFGPSTWFASLDHTLLCADKVVDKHYDDKIPSTMSCDIWIQMMAPFLSEDVRDSSAPEIFSHFISSQFWVARERVNYEDLKIIQGDWLSYSRLNEQDLREVLSEKFVKDYVKLAKSLLSEDKEIPEEAKEEFERELTVKVDNILNRKIDDYQGQLEQKEEELKELEERSKKVISSTQLKEDRTRTFWRQVAGVLGSILAIANIYSILIGQITFNLYSVPYLLGSWIAICVLLIIAIVPEKAQVAMKMILNLSRGSKD